MVSQHNTRPPTPIPTAVSGPPDPGYGHESTYYAGRFEYWTPPSFAVLDPSGLTLTQGAMEALEFAGVVAEWWRVGLDRKLALISIEPLEKPMPGAVRIEGQALKSAAMAEWLQGHGILPAIRVRWQEQTKSLCGRYEMRPPEERAPTAQPVVKPQPEKDVSLASPAPAAEATSARSAHDWVETDKKGPIGEGLLWQCSICGLYSSGPSSTIAADRPCYPGLYADSYHIRVDGRVATKNGVMQRTAIESRLKLLKRKGEEASL